MGKLEINKKKKRAALLNSAYELFVVHGISNTSVLNIALKAGVGKGTFYLYFNDKNDIKNELIIIKSSELLKAAANDLYTNSPSLPFAHKVIYIIDYLIDCFLKDLNLLKFISKNLSFGLLLESTDYASTDGVINFQNFFSHRMHEEKIELKDPELLVYTIIELVNSTCYNIILNKEPTSMEEYKPYLYKLITHMVEDSIIN
jgi:AcrR family transcriptional regulator